MEEATERPLRDENKNRVKKGDPVKMGSMVDLSANPAVCVFLNLYIQNNV